MKSIITADIFISGLPYLITNFFQGFLEEFILWASLSMLLRICCLVMYTLLPEGRGCVIAVSPICTLTVILSSIMFIPIKLCRSASLDESV